MADIAELYNYEHLFRLPILRPDTEESTGIVMMIRSSSSPEAKTIVRKQLDEITERQQRGKLVKGRTRLQHELQKVASYIASWDWGDNTYRGSAPELNMKTAIQILDEQDWIYVQVNEAATNLANFTTTPDAPASKRSGGR